MYYEEKIHSIDTLNQQIKSDLIQAQKLEPADQLHSDQGSQCNNTVCCKPSGINIRQKIGFQEKLMASGQLSAEAAGFQVQRLLLIFQMHRIRLLFNDPDQDPNILYKFITEEFLDIELPPHPPDMQFCFIYDKLQDDRIRDPETLVGRIFEPLLKEGRSDDFRYLNNRVKLNNYDNLSEPELHYVVNRYKSRYELIQNRHIRIESKQLHNDRLHMKGVHETVFCNHEVCDIITGNWHLELIPLHGTWWVVNIQIEGVEF